MTVRCLETRRRADGLRYRRYVEDGVTFWTVEMPVPVFNGVVRRDKVADKLASFNRGHAQRLRKQKVLDLNAAGEKATVIAEITGIGDRGVYNIVRRAAKKSQSIKKARNADNPYIA
jgi:hypothetical protein